MTDELIDLVDENNNPINKTEMKSIAHRDGLWHRAAHIWVYNEKGDILLQLRSKDKDLCPSMWDTSVGGHISAGEEPITSAIRETGEELGLEIKKDDLKFIKIQKAELQYKEINNKEFLYVYFLKTNKKINEFNIQKEELDDIKFFTIEEIKEGIRKANNSFLNHENYWSDIIHLLQEEIKNE